MLEIIKQPDVINRLSDVNEIVNKIIGTNAKRSPFSIITQVYEEVRLNNAIINGYGGDGSIQQVNTFMQDNKNCEIYDMNRFEGDSVKEKEFINSLKK